LKQIYPKDFAKVSSHICIHSVSHWYAAC